MKNFTNKPVQPEKIVGVSAEPVSNYMATNLITFTTETGIIEVINTLLEKKITGAPVINEKREVIGMLDDKVCLKVLVDSEYYNSPMSQNNAAHYMDDVFRTIPEKTSIVEAANIFLESRFKRLIVVDDHGKLKGQISRRDILRAIRDLNTITWRK